MHALMDIPPGLQLGDNARARRHNELLDSSQHSDPYPFAIGFSAINGVCTRLSHKSAAQANCSLAQKSKTHKLFLFVD
jgi:hypothetical protein